MTGFLGECNSSSGMLSLHCICFICERGVVVVDSVMCSLSDINATLLHIRHEKPI